MITPDTTVAALVAVVSEALEAAGIPAVLSGGAVVQIYSEERYVSKDLDFVTSASNREIERVLRRLGFERTEAQRLFGHPQSEYLIEFPPGPLALGDEIVKEWGEVRNSAGTIQILTPTQCVQDRLAAYFHWRDPQALDQAVLVARCQSVDLERVREWALAEGHELEHRHFKRALSAAR